ncbi:Cyclin-dependent kinase 10 [Actinomortierella ambigua]|nr:Cyclin-dependent kinase 10 [Actinomortierella ambigua]
MSSEASQETEILMNMSHRHDDLTKTSTSTATATSVPGAESSSSSREHRDSSFLDKEHNSWPSPSMRRRRSSTEPTTDARDQDTRDARRRSEQVGEGSGAEDRQKGNRSGGGGGGGEVGNEATDRSRGKSSGRDDQRRRSAGSDLTHPQRRPHQQQQEQQQPQQYQQPQRRSSQSESTERRGASDRRESRDISHRAGHDGPGPRSQDGKHSQQQQQHQHQQQYSEDRRLSNIRQDTNETAKEPQRKPSQKGQRQSSKQPQHHGPPDSSSSTRPQRHEVTGSSSAATATATATAAAPPPPATGTQGPSSILTKPDPYSLLSITGKMGVLDPKKAFVGQSRVVDDFEKLNKVGEGTYARDKKTKEIVALKRVRMERESDGLPISSLREIKLLKTLRHENVVLVKEVAVGNDLDQIFLVMEYCEQDMATLLDSIKTRYEPSEVKCLMYQLLKGIEYCHDRFVIHRDLKMSNLLLNSKGILKIADFGLARMYGTPTRPMTPKVVTLWYRAPELLFGDPNYTTAVDMWSAGCIFGELLQHSPLLPGKVEKQQVELIIDMLGTPHERVWQGFNKLPLSTVKLPEQRLNNLKIKFSNISDAALSLLNGLLTYDPKRRLTVKQALAHPYFIELPHAKHPSMLPTYPEIRNMKAEESQGSHSHSRGGGGGGAAAGGGGGGGAGRDRRDDSNRKRPAPQDDRGGGRGGGGGGGGAGDRTQQKRVK